MAYVVNVVARHEAYILGLPLSDEAKDLIRRFIKHVIGNVSDEFRNAPANRPRPGAPYFRMRLDLHDWWGDRRDRTVDFVVNDAGAAFGVLDLVWIDVQ